MYSVALKKLLKWPELQILELLKGVDEPFSVFIRELRVVRDEILRQWPPSQFIQKQA